MSSMLRTNLASRPFYNERAVRVALGVLVVAIVALTLFNVSRLATLRASSTRLAAQSASSEARARELRAGAAKIQQALQKDAESVVQTQARQANDLIARRAFSWTELFNRFEATLPPDVRILAVQPQTGSDHRLVVAITTLSKQVEDLDTFIERLEGTGAFQSTLSRQEELQEDGSVRSVVQGYYGAAAIAPPATSEEDSNPGPGAPRVAAAQGSAR